MNIFKIYSYKLGEIVSFKSLRETSNYFKKLVSFQKRINYDDDFFVTHVYQKKDLIFEDKIKIHRKNTQYMYDTLENLSIAKISDGGNNV